VIEAAGLEMGRELMDRADLVLLLADGAAPVDADTLDAARRIGPEKALAVLNKADLDAFDTQNGETLRAIGLETASVSAKSGAGLDRLSARIRERVLGNAGQPDPDELAPNARQAAVLAEADRELAALAGDTAAGIPYDLLSVRLETACDVLSGITGEIAANDILNSIFDSFCIGK